MGARKRVTGRSLAQGAVLGTLMLGVLGAGPAGADTTTIDSTLLDVFVGDTGRLQAKLAGSEDHVFFAPGDIVGDAGVTFGFPTTASNDVASTGSSAGVSRLVAHMGTGSIVDNAQPVTGDGTPASPYSLVRAFSVADDDGVAQLEVMQRVTVVNGTTRFKVHYDVENVSGKARNFRVTEAADLYIEGDDFGLGQFLAGPPRAVLGVNNDVGRSGGLEEVPAFPFDHYQVGEYDEITYDVPSDPDGAGYDDSVNSTVLDNGAGVQWDTHESTPLAPGATASFEIAWVFAAPAPMTLSPASQTLLTGQSASTSATLTDLAGTPQPGRTIRWDVQGANPAGGTLTTDAAGHATISWSGANAGEDTLTAFADFNGNGTREPVEPQAVGTFVFEARPVPVPPVVCGSACATPRDGTVPGLRIGGRARLKISRKTRSVAIPLTCSEPCTVVASAALKIARRRAPMELRSAPVTSAANGKATVRFALSKALVAKVRKAVRKRIKPTLRVTVTATDAAGNRGKPVTKTIRLKR
jgi:hypothetical protein